MNRSVSKSRIIKLSALTVSILCLLLNGCGNKNAASSSAAATATEAAAEPAPVTADEKNVLGRYVLGIDDRAILEGAKNIDLLARAESMKKVITKIDVDDSAVDTTKPGTYKVKYTVTVDVENLYRAEAYIAEHPEALEAPAVPAKEPDTGKAQAEANAEPADETSEMTDPAETSATQSGAEQQTAHPADETAPADNGEGSESVQSEDITSPEKPAEEKEAQPVNESDPAPTQSEETAAPAEKDGGQEKAEEENGKEQAEMPAVPAPETPDNGTVPQPQEPSAGPVLPNIPDEVFEDPASSDPEKPAETVEIVIEKEVTVVTPEEAAEIISGGGEVWTDDSMPVTAEDLTKEEASQAGTTAPAAVIPPADETVKETTEQTESAQPEEDNWEEQESSGSESQPSHSSDSGSESHHTHNWVERTETVHHDEQGHYESVQVGTKTVVDEEAWDEPVYEGKCVCSECGYSTFSESDIVNHIADVHDFDASYGVVSEQVDTIHHSAVTHEEPVYEDKWVVDSEAWSEEKVVGYYCSECGETK